MQRRRYGAEEQPTPCFHLLVSAKMAQSEASVYAGLFLRALI
jgi:hypothetical protein